DQFSSSMETNVVIHYDGQVTWDYCHLTFGSWTHNSNQMGLLNALDTADLVDFVEKIVLEVLGMPAKKNIILYSCCSDPYPDITYMLHLKRGASFYIFNLLIPIPCMISFLAPLGFFLLAGEKVSVGVTVLLPLIVFQLLVAESMPPSENIPLIVMSPVVFTSKYYIATMTMITASTALTIFIMNIHHCPDARPVPEWACRFILHYLARFCFAHEVDESGLSDNTKKPLHGGGRWTTKELLFTGEYVCHHQSLLRNIDYITGCYYDQRATQRLTGEWRKVAKVMDHFFIWIFFIMVLFMSLLILGKAI
uniref:Cholinergic receptor, nicotinic, alpha 10b n=1 Tax=Electrophorus electricus TaxID=8005 RepID=A0AAY5EY89_ELEEL